MNETDEPAEPIKSDPKKYDLVMDMMYVTWKVARTMGYARDQIEEMFDEASEGREW